MNEIAFVEPRHLYDMQCNSPPLAAIRRCNARMVHLTLKIKTIVDNSDKKICYILKSQNL